MHTDAQQQVHRHIPYIQSLRLWTVPVRGWQAAGPCCCLGSRWYKLNNCTYEKHCFSVWYSPAFTLPYICMWWSKLGRQKEFNFCRRMCRYMVADSPHTKCFAAHFFTLQPVSSCAQENDSLWHIARDVSAHILRYSNVFLVRTIPGQIFKAELWVLISSSIHVLDINRPWVSSDVLGT